MEFVLHDRDIWYGAPRRGKGNIPPFPFPERTDARKIMNLRAALCMGEPRDLSYTRWMAQQE